MQTHVRLARASSLGIILHQADLSYPMAPADLFGRNGAYVLEIGFGNGDFLCGLAGDNPSWNILGAETSPSSVVRAFKRIRRRGLSNVKLYAGAGEFVVRNVIPDGMLDHLYVNFPDPWPRRRHHDRRLLSSEFFELVASRLKTGGQLLLTTDHDDYFSFARRRAASTGLFRCEEGADPTRAVLDTRWARRWLEQGRSIHHARFIKTADPPTSSKRIDRTEMRHALLRGSLDKISQIDRVVVQQKGVNIVVTEAYRQIGDDAVIFPTIVEENDLRQFVIIEAHPRDDEVLVGVKRFGHPLSTPGINLAVAVVADLLETMGLEMLERSY